VIICLASCQGPHEIMLRPGFGLRALCLTPVLHALVFRFMTSPVGSRSSVTFTDYVWMTSFTAERLIADWLSRFVVGRILRGSQPLASVRWLCSSELVARGEFATLLVWTQLEDVRQYHIKGGGQTVHDTSPWICVWCFNGLWSYEGKVCVFITQTKKKANLLFLSLN